MSHAFRPVYVRPIQETCINKQLVSLRLSAGHPFAWITASAQWRPSATAAAEAFRKPRSLSQRLSVYFPFWQCFVDSPRGLGEPSFPTKQSHFGRQSRYLCFSQSLVWHFPPHVFLPFNVSSVLLDSVLCVRYYSKTRTADDCRN